MVKLSRTEDGRCTDCYRADKPVPGAALALSNPPGVASAVDRSRARSRSRNKRIHQRLDRLRRSLAEITGELKQIADEM